MRARLFFALVTALGCATAAGAQTPPQVRAEVARLPDGRGVAVHCLGDSGPVVLLNSGLGMDAGVWTKVQGGLAARHRACALDRPGYGRSDEAAAPRDADHMAEDLRAAAKAAGLPGPYILVGHSLGGDAVRYWASRHPPEVAALVLVDPNIDGADAPLKAASPAFVRAMALMDLEAGKCIRATAAGQMKPGEPLYAACGSPPVDSPFARPAMARTVLAEQALQTVSSQQVQAAEARGYGKLPLVVLTAGGQFAPGSGPAPGQAWPEAERLALRRVWLEGHEAITRRSAAGLHRVIDGAPHAIHLARPEAVVQAIEEVAAGRGTERRP